MPSCSNMTSKFCKVCGQLESIYHLFATCTVAKQVWQHFLPFFTKLLPDCNILIHPHLMLGIFPVSGQPTTNFSRRLAFTLSSTIVHALWVARVNHRNGDRKPTFALVKSQVCSRIRDIIKHKFRIFTNNGTIAEFRQRFAVNDAICSVSLTKQLYIYI